MVDQTHSLAGGGADQGTCDLDLGGEGCSSLGYVGVGGWEAPLDSCCVPLALGQVPGREAFLVTWLPETHIQPSTLLQDTNYSAVLY